MSTFNESPNLINHEEIILHLLRQDHGEWVSGKTLFDASGTTDLGARMTALRWDGWTIESRKSRGEGFFDYRVVGSKGVRPGRKQFIVPVPRSQLSTPLTDLESLEMQSALEACLAELLTRRTQPQVEAKKEVDPIDWLLSNILEAK